MFTSVKDARTALAEVFPAPLVETLVSSLQPCFGFEPASGEPTTGGTRIGGTPDLGPDVTWPIRAVPDNLDAIAARGGFNHQDQIFRDLSQPRPYEFLLQVDLAEAAAASGTIAEALPADGRLLFFYDGSSGPWRNDATTCRVIWDRTPREALKPVERPQALLDMRQQYVEDWNAQIAKYPSLSPYPENKSPYWGPARAMSLVPRFNLPDFASLEAQSNPALLKALEDDEVKEDYQSFFADYFEGSELMRQQLLGSPVPEQDDPRYDAAADALYEGNPPSGDAWRAAFPTIAEKAGDWLLLMQVSLSDYLQQRLVEGTVYFVIRRQDLAARAFDRVLPIYQQT